MAIYPDISIASENAKFRLPEITVGIWPMMVSAALRRLIGRKKALELMLTGRMIDAWEAERIGLINKVVPAEELDKSVGELANTLKGMSPIIMKLGLEAFYATEDMEFSKAVAYLREMVVELFYTEDAHEGEVAFFEKRKPVWKGR